MRPIACLLATFPTTTETFIVGEIQELRRRGVPIALFALAGAGGTVPQPEAMALARETTYAAPLASGRLLAANARWLARRPGRYLGALGLLFRRTWRNPVHLLKTLYLFPKAVELGDRMSGQGIEHVHAHWSTYPTTVALVLSHVTGLRYSFTAHAGDVTLFRTLLGEKIRRARFVVTCTDDLRADLARLAPAGGGGKVHLNYHGVTLERFPRRARPEPAVPTILACGALYKRKGFAEIVEACAILRDRGRDFRCVIVGDGPNRRHLERLIARTRLGERVTLVGAAPQSEVARRYAEADVFALPCSERPVSVWDPEADLMKSLEAWFEPAGGVIKDGIPNVLVEAMATGLPVVSTPISGIPELIRDGVNGLLVPPQDPVRLAGALERLLLDPSLRRKLGDQAAEDVRERFDRRKNVVELVEIFGRYLDGAAARPQAAGVVG